jgi:putative endopeptidase
LSRCAATGHRVAATFAGVTTRHFSNLLALLLALSLWGAFPSAAQTADSSVAPGDDFFAYANRDWLQSAAIPAGKERWSGRDEIGDLVRGRIAALLDDAGAAPAGSTARKVADYRAAYLNEAAIEARGMTPIEPLLARIANVSNRAELTRLLGRGMRADVDPLGFGIYQSASVLGLSVAQSIHGEKTNTAFLVQGGLGLPDREDYGDAAVRARYLESIRKTLTLAGFDRADERGAAVLALEMAIAQSHGSRETSANDRNADNVWTRADFSRRAPGMDWRLFFDGAGLARQGELVVWQPTAVTGLAELVGSQPLDTWKDYLRFHAIRDFADVLPRKFADAAGEGRRDGAQPAGGTPALLGERALAATQSAMRDALGRMYVERYFPPEQKARVERISDNVRAALMKRVEAATWMSPATKASALSKLKTLYVGIGYPERWEDYSSLTIDATDPLGNLQRLSDRAYRNAVARLGQPVDLKSWAMSPQTVGALLVFQQNA